MGNNTSSLSNNEQEVQECDARNDATTTEAGNQNKTSNSEATILSAPDILKKHCKDDLINKEHNPRRLNMTKKEIINAMEEYKNQFK
jgi:hypothetical protein